MRVERTTLFVRGGVPPMEEGRFLGLVCLADVREIPRERRAETGVGEIMTPAGDLRTLPSDDRATDVLEILADARVNQLPVVGVGRLLRLVRREDILKWLSLSRASPHAGPGNQTTRR
jgi:CBS domain-containing protein